MKSLLFSFSFLLFTFFAFSQTITILANKPGVSLRGLSVVNNNIIWASGNGGTVVRSVDGGKTFEWQNVAGYEGRDFRDVEAFDGNTAIIMAVAEPAVILKTTDGGKTWNKVFEDSAKGMFLDAMNFVEKNGVVVGDPIDNKMFVATTKNGGDSWQVLSPEERILMVKGEAFFASSGTNVRLLNKSKKGFSYCVVSGGREANFIMNTKYKLPLLQGKESQGANSIAIGDKRMIVVGGDFADNKDTSGNCAFSDDRGKTWRSPQTSPHGYRSCVAFINKDKWITCGTSGVDISNNNGENWTLISGESFHVCQKSKAGNAVFLAGANGRIAKLVE